MIFGEHYFFFQLCRGILALCFLFVFLMKPVILSVYLLVPFHPLVVLLEAGCCPTLERFS